MAGQWKGSAESGQYYELDGKVVIQIQPRPRTSMGREVGTNWRVDWRKPGSLRWERFGTYREHAEALTMADEVVLPPLLRVAGDSTSSGGKGR